MVTASQLRQIRRPIGRQPIRVQPIVAPQRIEQAIEQQQESIRIGSKDFSLAAVNRAISHANAVARGKPDPGFNKALGGQAKRAFDSLQSSSTEFRRSILSGQLARRGFSSLQQLEETKIRLEARRTIKPPEIVSEQQKRIDKLLGKDKGFIFKPTKVKDKVTFDRIITAFDKDATPTTFKLSPTQKVKSLISQFRKDPQKFISEKGKKVSEDIFKVVSFLPTTFAEIQTAKQTVIARTGEQELFGKKPFEELLPFEKRGTGIVTNISFLSNEDLIKNLPFGASNELVFRKQAEVDTKSQIEIDKSIKANLSFFQNQSNTGINNLLGDVQNRINSGKLSLEQGQLEFDRKSKKILRDIQRDFDDKVNDDVGDKLDKITSDAKAFIDSKTSAIATSQAIALIPISIATGAGLALVGGVPVLGTIASGAIIGASIVQAPNIIRSSIEAPLGSFIQVGSFVLGGGIVSLGRKGLNIDFKKLNKTFNKKLQTVLRFEKQLLKDKRATSFTEAAQILKKKVKKKVKGQISKAEAIKQFKEKFRNEKINIVEVALKNQIREKGVISQQEMANLKKFLQDSGLKQFEIEDIIAEVFRRQAVQLLRADKKAGLLTSREFSDQFNKLNNLKAQLVKRLRKFNQLEFEQQQVVQRPPIIRQVGFIKEGKFREIPFQKFKEVPLVSSARGLARNQAQTAFNKLSLSERFALAQKGKSVSVFKSALAFKSAFRSALASKSATVQRERLRLRSLVIQKSSLRQISQQRSRLQSALISLSRTKLELKRRPFKRKGEVKRPPIKLKAPPLIFFPKKKPKRKQIRKIKRLKKFGYNVFVKSKGKFKKMNVNPLKKNKASDLGAFLTDHSTARTFLIKQSNEKIKVPKLKVPSSYFARTQKKFRKPIRKGVKLKLSPLFIEKKSHLIDTRGEKKGLKVARLRARLFKKVTRRKKK